jgi:hypothetical protein
MSNYRCRDIWWIILFSCSANSGSWFRVCVLECWDFFVGMLFYGRVARTLRFWIQKRAHELCMAVSKPLKNFAALFRWCWSAGCGSAQLHTIAQVLTSHGGVGACRLPLAHTFPVKFLYSSYTPVLICRQISEYMFVHAF